MQDVFASNNGVEASLDAKITEQWHLLANATAQDAVVTAAPQSIATIGNHPQGVPLYMANLWSTYKFSIGGIPGFQVGAGANYRTGPIATRRTSTRSPPM